MNSGKLIVISGPSGVGKSTVISRIMEQHPDMHFSVSATTRPMRGADVDGVTYHFKTIPQFEAMIAEGGFLEHARYNGNYYGTPKAPVEEHLQSGGDVIMDIDVQGAMQVRENTSEAILIFLVAKTFDVILERLRSRGDTSEEDIEKRLQQAKWEYSQAGRYDYIVVSDKLEETADAIEAIIKAEKHKADRMVKVLGLEG